MLGLFLVLLAFALIIVETHIPSMGIFGVLALASLVAGGKILVDQGSLFGMQMDWQVFAGIGLAMIVYLVIVVRVGARAFVKNDTTGIEGMVGENAVIEDWTGTAGRVTIQGELWQAESLHPHDLTKGDVVTVSAVHGLKLRITEKSA